MYAIDPLESRESPPAARTFVSLTHQSSIEQRGCSSSTPGVAVGLGWLSDALRSADPPSVFGTLMSDGIRDDSLEVIFSLREVRSPFP